LSTPVITPTTQSLTTQKLDVVAEFQALIDGINSMLTGIDPFILGGITISRADLLAKLQARIDAAVKTKNDRKAVAADVAAEQAAAVVANPLRKGIKALCISRYGATSPVLQQLGFVQNRPPKRKSTNVAAGAAKRQATRTAVGPTGKQERAAAAAKATSSTEAKPPVAEQPAPVAAPVTGTQHAPVNGGTNQGSSS
jgi:hypothetical protein